MSGSHLVGRDRWDPSAIERDAERHAQFLQRAAGSKQVRAAAAVASEMMRLAPGQSVLEVGCGTGYILPDLAGAVAPDGRVVGVDQSAELLRVAQQRMADAGLADTVSLVVGDATALDLPDDAFDIARTERVLMHLDDPNQQLSEMRRVVRPGGLVVAIEPDMRCIHIDGSNDPEVVELLAARLAGGTRSPSVGLELRRRMVTTGFVDVELRHVPTLMTEFDDFEFVRWDQGIDTAVGDGLIERARAEEAVASLQAASDSGTLAGVISFYVGAGRVPPR